MTAALLERFAALYPSLYHMAEAGSWPVICERGLLSTTALLDLFEIDGAERSSIESRWRPESIPIEHPSYGRAVIRDQKPMPPGGLEAALTNVSPTEWYRFLNRKAFLWLSEDRLMRMLNAAPYRNHYHDVLTLDTHDLVSEYVEQVSVCQINSGFARPMFGRVTKRSFDSFQTIERRARTHGLHGLAELTVEYAVPDVARFVRSVESWRGNTRLGMVWQP